MTHLLEIAEQDGIDVYLFPMQELRSCSIPNAVAINPQKVKTRIEFRECFAHELGHQKRTHFII